MRWPFGPPHLTLKPSKNNTKKTKKGKKKKRKKTQTKNPKIQKRAFQLSVNFSFFGGCPKFPFLTTWPKKRAPKKHNKNRGFSNPFFGKQFCVTSRPLLDKKPNPEIPIILFSPFSSFSTTKTTKIG